MGRPLLLASATPPSPPAAPADSSSRFHDLVSGRRRGPLAALARGGLWLASLPYGLAVRLRNLAYSIGWKRSVRTAVPVVSVGNLTVGGTGKTPCVEYVAGYFNDRDCRVCILSRGYGSGESAQNDEALVLAENLPDVPHLQGADRAALACVAIEELESEILVLDDGFQHRRLARDLDLVLIDSTRPWGHGHLLPRGLLREPPSSLRRADAVILTRCDLVGQEERQAIHRRVERLAPGVPIVESVHRPIALVNADGETLDAGALAGATVAWFCGIGNPEAFGRTLEALGYQAIGSHVYPDHHGYTRPDVEALEAWARTLPDDASVVTTQKDLVKLRLSMLGERPLWALRVGLVITAGADALHALFERVLARMERTG
jgi:tetraacyldisaccharide 4'-kinase